MEIIIRLLILLFLAIFGVSSQESSAPPPVVEVTPVTPPEETFESLTHIDSVEALVLESFPVQLQLHIIGAQPDGCDFPVQIEQQRDGNAITLKIFREVPLTVMCPAVLINYDETITLEGTFEPGTYTIDVNGFVIEVTI
jgi:hypothetical protein